MIELELARTPDDRRLYELDGVGTLRLQGLGSRSAVAEAGRRSWQVARRGFWGRRVEATDAAGSVDGEFEPRVVRCGGALRWGAEYFELRPASSWRERYALVAGDRELAVLGGKGWGRRPVKVSVEDGGIDPGLLLFAAFVVRGLAEDASGSAGAGAAAAVATIG